MSGHLQTGARAQSLALQAVVITGVKEDGLWPPSLFGFLGLHGEEAQEMRLSHRERGSETSSLALGVKMPRSASFFRPAAGKGPSIICMVFGLASSPRNARNWQNHLVGIAPATGGPAQAMRQDTGKLADFGWRCNRGSLIGK